MGGSSGCVLTKLASGCSGSWLEQEVIHTSSPHHLDAQISSPLPGPVRAVAACLRQHRVLILTPPQYLCCGWCTILVGRKARGLGRSCGPGRKARRELCEANTGGLPGRGSVRQTRKEEHPGRTWKPSCVGPESPQHAEAECGLCPPPWQHRGAECGPCARPCPLYLVPSSSCPVTWGASLRERMQKQLSLADLTDHSQKLSLCRCVAKPLPGPGPTPAAWLGCLLDSAHTTTPTSLAPATNTLGTQS